MQPEHRIDDLIVDLSFTTTRLARRENAILAEWLSEDLLPALDQIFSQFSPGHKILRFETLEFDFGNVSSRYYQQHITFKRYYGGIQRWSATIRFSYSLFCT